MILNYNSAYLDRIDQVLILNDINNLPRLGGVDQVSILNNIEL